MNSKIGSGRSSLVEQLLAARARAGIGAVDGSFLGPTERFWKLDQSLSRLGKNADEELYRHFPIAAVAALESHFKLAIAAIVNSERLYAERGLQLAKERLKNAPEVIPVIHDRSITIGELVAHWVPFSSLAHYEATFSNLLDLDFKRAVSSAVDPSQARSGAGDHAPIVADINDLWRQIAETFELRHILAHEAASGYAVTFESARSAVDCCATLSNATEAVIWQTAWRNEPLTQYEMNVAERKCAHEARLKLAAVMRAARRELAGTEAYSRLRENHFAWRRVARDLIEWGTGAAVGYSMFPMLVSSGYKTADSTIAVEVENYLRYMRR